MDLVGNGARRLGKRLRGQRPRARNVDPRWPGPSSVVTETPDPQQPAAEVGSLAGHVSDDEGFPIAQAAISLLERSLTAVTDADGAFAFEGLRLGRITLVAEKVGFHDVTRSLDVRAGDPMTIAVQLIRRAAIEPTYDILEDRGRFACMLVTPVVTSSTNYCDQRPFGYGVAVDDNHHWSMTFNATPEISHTVSETQWTPSTNLHATTLRSTLYWDNWVADKWVNMKSQAQSGSAPVIRIESDFYQGNVTETTRIRVTTLPAATSAENPVTLLYQQEFDVYLTRFFHYDAVPEGWTALDTE